MLRTDEPVLTFKTIDCHTEPPYVSESRHDGPCNSAVVLHGFSVDQSDLFVGSFDQSGDFVYSVVFGSLCREDFCE